MYRLRHIEEPKDEWILCFKMVTEAAEFFALLRCLSIIEVLASLEYVNVLDVG
jgi:hypothetical protein